MISTSCANNAPAAGKNAAPAPILPYPCGHPIAGEDTAYLPRLYRFRIPSDDPPKRIPHNLRSPGSRHFYIRADCPPPAEKFNAIRPEFHRFCVPPQTGDGKNAARPSLRCCFCVRGAARRSDSRRCLIPANDLPPKRLPRIPLRRAAFLIPRRRPAESERA